MREESPQKKKKIFWIWTSLLFIIVIVLWIVFGGAFGFNNKFSGAGYFGELQSVWGNVKNAFGSSTKEFSQAKDQINNLINYAMTSSTASTTDNQSTTTLTTTTIEQQTNTSTFQQSTTTNQ